MITSVIFDLDGLLTDTERLHMRAYRESFAELGWDLAAHGGGMKSIAAPNCYTRDNDFSLADSIVSSLNDITLKLINSLA